MLQSDIYQIAQNLPAAVVDALAGKRVLLTGGRGFLGRYFTAVSSELNQTRLAGREVESVVLDNFASSGELGRAAECGPHETFHPCDAAQPWPVVGRVDYILFLAGIASPAHYRAKPVETIEVVTRGLPRALELAAHWKARLLFFSSSEIYGDPAPEAVPTPETYRGNVACLGPRACYDESKRLGETLVQVYCQTRGVSASIVRPFNVYGPGMQHTDYRVLPNFAARLAKGEPLEVYGDGRQTRTYCYVTDAVDGFLRALVLGRPGEPYNIGNPEPEVSVNRLAELVGDVVDDRVRVDVKPHPPSYPADEPSRRCPSIDKAQAELGYGPFVKLADGLDRFFGWALASYPRE